MTITREEVLDTLQGMADDYDPDASAGGDRFIIRDWIGENWDAGEGLWRVSNGIGRCLELLGVEDVDERIDWFSLIALTPADLVILANVDFQLILCDVCGDNYHLADVDADFQSTHAVEPRGGETYNNCRDNDVNICDHCLETNKVVGLFTS